MKKIAKKTKYVLLILALLLTAVIGGTVAYYTSQQTFLNEFKVSRPGMVIVEQFSPDDHWVPGEEKSKEVWFTNTGNMDMLLRFSVTAEWEEDSEHPDVDPNTVITLYWNEGNGKTDQVPVDFVKKSVTENEKTKDYYYYTKVLKAGESTQHVLKSVKFSKALSNDGHLHSDYSNTQINLTLTGETILANEDEAAEQWKTTPQVKAEIHEDGSVTWTQK